MKVSVGSLCSGYLGLELAVGNIFDTDLKWVSEIDRHASIWLEKTHPDVPNIGDIALEDWSGVEPVDIVVGGVPCQPYSLAGKRKGEHDPRDLLWIVPLIAGQMGPRLIMLENVVRLARRPEWFALAGELSEVGYDMRWTTLRASDVGACHRRERLFAVAYPHGGGYGDSEEGFGVGCLDGGVEEETQQQQRSREEPVDRGTEDNGDGLPVGGKRLPTPRARDWKGPGYHDTLGAVARDHLKMLPTPMKIQSRICTTTRKGDFYAEGRTLHDVVYLDAFGEYADAVKIHAEVTGVAPPSATDDKGRLSPEFVEWMMMLPEGWVTDPDIGLPRTGHLKMLGNGVVPLQAETAYRYLLGVGQ